MTRIIEWYYTLFVSVIIFSREWIILQKIFFIKLSNFPMFSSNFKLVKKQSFSLCLVTVFFPLFSIFKNNFLFLRLKNLFDNSKRAENKNCFQNSICEGNWKHAKNCFQFLIFKSQWKYAFNLMNLFHLMS